MNVQWFPGHMAKTRRMMSEQLGLIDIVVELLDARLPLSSQNPEISNIIGDKPRLIILNKADLAGENYQLYFTGCVGHYSNDAVTIYITNTSKREI